MEYDRFTRRGRPRAQFDANDQAMQRVRLSLTTLGERVMPDEAGGVAVQLPPRSQGVLTEPQRPQRFDVADFCQQGNGNEGGSAEEAARHGPAVMNVPCEAVTPGGIVHTRSQISKDYAPLIDAGAGP